MVPRAGDPSGKEAGLPLNPTLPFTAWGGAAPFLLSSSLCPFPAAVPICSNTSVGKDVSRSQAGDGAEMGCKISVRN